MPELYSQLASISVGLSSLYCCWTHVSMASRNKSLDVELHEHPMDPYFRELRDRRRKELRR